MIPFWGSEVVPDEPGRLAGPARPPGPRLAGRWAASREGNEGRAQEGAQRAGAEAGRRLGGVWKASGRRPGAAWERFAGRLGDVWAHTGGRSWRRRRAQVRRAVVVVGRGGAAGGVAPGSQRFPQEGSLQLSRVGASARQGRRSFRFTPIPAGGLLVKAFIKSLAFKDFSLRPLPHNEMRFHEMLCFMSKPLWG